MDHQILPFIPGSSTMQRATCTGIRIRSPSDARVIFHAVLLGILPMVTRRLDTEERSMISPGAVYVWEERGPQAELTGVSSTTSIFYFQAFPTCLPYWRSASSVGPMVRCFWSVNPMGINQMWKGIRWGPSRVREVGLYVTRWCPCQLIASLGVPFLSWEATTETFVFGVTKRSRRFVSIVSLRHYNLKGPSLMISLIWFQIRSYSSYLNQTNIHCLREYSKGTTKVASEWVPLQISFWLGFIRDPVAYFTEDSIKRLCSIDEIPYLSNILVPHANYKSARSAKGRPDRIFNAESESESSRIDYVPYKHGYSHPSQLQTPSSSQYSSSWPESPLQPGNSPSPSYTWQGHGSSLSLNDGLAPLEYLQNNQPLHRHPVDEKVLMRFDSTGLL